jgi:hypothetical protein
VTAAKRKPAGDRGSELLLWKTAGIGLTLLMLAGLGAFLVGLNALFGEGGAGAFLGVILGVAAAPGFGWLATKAADRVEYLEGGLVRHQTKRASLIAGAAILLVAMALLWFWIFPWIDRTFVNRPAVGG